MSQFYKERGFQGVLIITILIFVSIFYHEWKINSILSKKSVFTIGEIKKIQYFISGEPMAVIEFKCKGTKNEVGANLGSDIKRERKIGDRLFIQFSPKDPTIYRALEEPKVPDSLIAPDNGWDKIPI